MKEPHKTLVVDEPQILRPFEIRILYKNLAPIQLTPCPSAWVVTHFFIVPLCQPAHDFPKGDNSTWTHSQSAAADKGINPSALMAKSDI